jgi:hypothetical protein
MLPNEEGSVPVRLLIDIYKYFIFRKLLPAVAGNEPTNLLLWIWNWINLLKDQTPTGMLPPKEFPWTMKYSKEVMLPREAGRVPLNLFKCK